nr:hypothetical protein GCM10025732_47670 [Glycomyces mayteni]
MYYDTEGRLIELHEDEENDWWEDVMQDEFLDESDEYEGRRDAAY